MRTCNFLTEFPTLHPMDSYPCMSIHPLIPMIELFLKIWPSKSKVKVIAQGHIIGITSYRPWLSIWPWKSRVKVMGEVIVQNHKVGLTSYRLTSLSFHVNLASHCWVKTFQNLTLKFKGQGHGWGHSSKSQCVSNILSTHIPFVPCQSALPLLTYSIIKIWP